jgi:hypothetical protein
MVMVDMCAMIFDRWDSARQSGTLCRALFTGVAPFVGGPMMTDGADGSREQSAPSLSLLPYRFKFVGWHRIDCRSVVAANHREPPTTMCAKGT